jgi:sec-independent protein translocase protein TatC
MSDSPEAEIEKSESDGREQFVAKTFWEHLEDLRWMLIKMVAAVAIAVVGCFVFAKEIFDYIKEPLRQVVGDDKVQDFLWSREVTGGFMMGMKLAFFAGIVAACPFLLWFLGQFLLPALTRRERRMVLPVFAFGVGLFLGGCALAYFGVLPLTLQFFIAYNDYLGISSRWEVTDYASFVSMLLLAFGIAFELPLVVLALAKLGLVTSKFLRDKRPYVIVIIFIVAAVLTPPDVVSQVMLGVPMVVLYELCIWIAWWMERRKRE